MILPIDDSMMCAYDLVKSACFGDSGGPLYDLENNMLIGVVSWGISCGSPPTVYSRIASQVRVSRKISF